MATSTRLMHARDGLSGVTIRARSAPPPLWQVSTCMSAAWTELCMLSRDYARAILARLISIRRGGGGVEGMGGPLWPPALGVVKPCGGYPHGTTGGPKGAPPPSPPPSPPLNAGLAFWVNGDLATA